MKSLADSPPIYVLSPREEIMLCRLICTGEYCIDTISTLEAKMKNHINPLYRDEIDFSAQVDAFIDMINFVISVLVSAIVERIDSQALKGMRNTNWATFEMTVGSDESRYVKEIRNMLIECVPRLRTYITSKVYFLNLTMKLSVALLDKFHENVWSRKRIGMTGAAQLLLDLNEITTFLSKLPQISLTVSDADDSNGDNKNSYKISKSYLSVINSHASKTEVVLKLVCTDDEKLQETFYIVWPDGSNNDYKRVIDLKSRAGITAPLEQVGGKYIGDITHRITHGAKSAFGGISGDINNVADDMKALFGGKGLFDDSPSVAVSHNAKKTSSSTPNKKPSKPL